MVASADDNGASQVQLLSFVRFMQLEKMSEVTNLHNIITMLFFLNPLMCLFNENEIN